jgi:type I restriction enzyme S subunit
MEEWKEYKIGEIAQTNVSQYSLSENWQIIQYLDTGSITMNQISNIGLFNGNKGLPSRARRKVKKGDIIFSAVRPNLCHYGYMDNPPSNLLVSTGFVVITVNAKIVDSRLLLSDTK